jgi:hypothetical protein
MLLKIGQARLINFIGIPYKCKALHRCFFLGIWKHLPKWKILSSNEGTFHIQKVFPNTKEKKPWKMLLCRKPWLAINWDVQQAFLSFQAYSWGPSQIFWPTLPATTLGLQASYFWRLWGPWLPLYFSHWKLFEIEVRVTLDKGPRSRDQWIQAILLVESFKLVPRSLDEGTRPKGGKLRLTLHGTCFGGKINWFGPKKQC